MSQCRIVAIESDKLGAHNLVARPLQTGSQSVRPLVSLEIVMEEFINIVNDSRNCIDIDEKITNLLIDVSGGNLKSAMQLIKELKFQDDVSCNIKEQIKKQLSLLVLQKSIEYDVDATSLLLSKRKEEISYLDDSINLLKEKADEGSAIAQYMLGECYENGIGVTQDDDKAYSLFLSASA